MPFTLTHTLAVLPIARQSRRLPFMALAIGAMVPDWGLFVPFGPDYKTTHTWAGLLLACLPLGLLLYLAFCGLYGRALVELLPEVVQKRLGDLRRWHWPMTRSHLSWSAMAVLLGASTHILWDAFTHRGRWGVEALPFLTEQWLTLGSTPVLGYQLLQHGSSLVGLPLLALLMVHYLRQQPEDRRAAPLLSPLARLSIAATLLLVPAMIAARHVAPYLDGVFSLYSLRDDLFYFVTDFGLYLLVLFNAYAIGLYLLAYDGPSFVGQFLRDR